MSISNALLFWDTRPSGKVLLSRDSRALEAKLRSSLLLGGGLLIRPAELIEGSVVSEAATSGTLRTFLEHGLVRMAVPSGGTLRSHAEWGFLNPPKRKQAVSFDGRDYSRDRVPKTVLNTIESRLSSLESAGWNDHRFEFKQSIFNGRPDLYVAVVKRIHESFPVDAMLTYIRNPHPIANRGEIFYQAKTVWQFKIPICKRHEFLGRLQAELDHATVLHLANALGGAVSWLNPRSWLTRQDGPCGMAEKVVSNATVLAVKAIAMSLSQGGEEDMRILLDPTQTNANRFIEYLKQIDSRDRNDMAALLFGNWREGNDRTFVSSLITRDSSLITLREAIRKAQSRVREFEGGRRLGAEGREMVRNVASLMGFVLAFPCFPPELQKDGAVLSATAIAGSLYDLYSNRRGVLACFRRGTTNKY